MRDRILIAYNAVRKWLGLPIVGIVLGCGHVQHMPPGRFVVEVQWDENGSVYRDFPDVYDTLSDCLDALPDYVDVDVLSLGCVVYE